MGLVLASRNGGAEDVWDEMFSICWYPILHVVTLVIDLAVMARLIACSPWGIFTT
jgi:hypothetical protein